MNNIPTMTKNLLIVNFLAFVATWVLELRGIDITSLLGLHFFLAKDFHLYQFITYMFLHGGFTHIFFNMFALWMFGAVVERVWGPKKFLFYYISCGIGAGLIQEVAQYVNYIAEGLDTFERVNLGGTLMLTEDYLNLWTTIGASGAVYAILLAFGMIFPNERLFIIPFPFPIKAKWLVGRSRGQEFFDNMKHRFDERKQNGRRRWVDEPDEEKPHAEEPPKKKWENQEEIDAILDKIRKSGYDSLTKEEKKKLFDQSKGN